jgi:hypothetical protein
VVEFGFGEEMFDRAATPRHFGVAKSWIFRLRNRTQLRRQRQIRCRPESCHFFRLIRSHGPHIKGMGLANPFC